MACLVYTFCTDENPSSSPPVRVLAGGDSRQRKVGMLGLQRGGISVPPVGTPGRRQFGFSAELRPLKQEGD
jgi:hypothetical protein